MPSGPVLTYGLTHIALTVADPERSASFYGALLGARVTYRDADHVEVQTPRAKDVLAFVRGARRGGSAGVQHFGFRLRHARDLDLVVTKVRRAGATHIRTGTFGPRQPYAFFHDPDGYEVEVWFEPASSTRP